MKKEGVNEFRANKGKELLNEALDSMHIENWLKYPSYEFVMTDRWEKQMGMNMSPWPGENNALLKYCAAFNTFDSRVEWLEGSMKGKVMGMQSWQLYESDSTGKIKKTEGDKKQRFILPTVQYFMELPLRLSNAPLISFTDTVTWNGQKYDCVMATWEKFEPNKNDQYLIYINQKTKRIERVTYTIRDNYIFTPRNFFGSAYFSDFRTVQGVVIPFRMDVYPFDWENKMKVHSMQINELKLDSTSLNKLYPFSDLPKMGDNKK